MMAGGFFKLPAELEDGIELLSARSMRINRFARNGVISATLLFIAAAGIAGVKYFTVPDLATMTLHAVDVPALLANLPGPDDARAFGPDALTHLSSSVVSLFTGKWVTALSLVAFLATGATMMAGVEVDEVLKKVMGIVSALALMVGGINIASSFGMLDIASSTTRTESKSWPNRLNELVKGDSEGARRMVLRAGGSIHDAAYVALQVSLMNYPVSTSQETPEREQLLASLRKDLALVNQTAGKDNDVDDYGKVLFIADRTVFGASESKPAREYEAMIVARKSRLSFYLTLCLGAAFLQSILSGLLATFGLQIKRRVARIDALLAKVMVLGTVDASAVTTTGVEQE